MFVFLSEICIRRAPQHKKRSRLESGGRLSKQSLGWVLYVAGGEALRWIYIQGGPISGGGAAGKRSQMITFPLAVVKGFLSTLGGRRFLLEEFSAVCE